MKRLIILVRYILSHQGPCEISQFFPFFMLLKWKLKTSFFNANQYCMSKKTFREIQDLSAKRRRNQRDVFFLKKQASAMFDFRRKNNFSVIRFLKFFMLLKWKLKEKSFLPKMFFFFFPRK